jgi:hypothetical protein
MVISFFDVQHIDLTQTTNFASPNDKQALWMGGKPGSSSS